MIPQVLIAFKKFHFTMASVNHYKASVTNKNNKGFTILYETETPKMEFGGEIQWIAFDQTSDFFGEVLYIEENET